MSNKSLKERFESKVTEKDGSTCLWWTGAKLPEGYGQIKVGRKNKRAHRVSYELYVGVIPDGLHVLHKCDEPSCVNPNHLILGTNLDNVKDKITKGRQQDSRGVNNPFSKLSDAIVRNIKEWPKVKGSGVYLAKLYGVHPSLISLIRLNKIWKHVLVAHKV